MSSSIWLQLDNAPARLMRQHTFAEYRREIASDFTFRPLSESSGGPLTTPITTFRPKSAYSSNRYCIPTYSFPRGLQRSGHSFRTPPSPWSSTLPLGAVINEDPLTFSRGRFCSSRSKMGPPGWAHPPTLIKYGCDVAASAVTFRPLNDNCGGPLDPLYTSHSALRQPTPSYIRYPIPTQEAGNSLMASSKLPSHVHTVAGRRTEPERPISRIGKRKLMYYGEAGNINTQRNQVADRGGIGGMRAHFQSVYSRLFDRFVKK
ncbi:hypothetical protein EVAR_68496_1 [Eumeta japonica]|uniref:Uncharacterized protein n=1 Tax=Eumeta variegata TaxID=151549 RepID=A0A4C1ZWT5_EUMVA|nr:hypothetical protein EVAR_68496_1 [Eumeta japonica]